MAKHQPPKKVSRYERAKTVIIRMIAVFVSHGLAIIGAGSIIGIDTLSSVLLAGSLGGAKVTEDLARAYLDDGKLTIDEINEVFGTMDEKS